MKGEQFLYLQPKIREIGELAEWLNAAVLKTVKDASPSGVRIPDSPQSQNKALKTKHFGA